MKYKTLFFFIFFETFLAAQKLRVLDTETSAPVLNARIIADNKIYYTNDDGFALLADDKHPLEINKAIVYPK